MCRLVGRSRRAMVASNSDAGGVVGSVVVVVLLCWSTRQFHGVTAAVNRTTVQLVSSFDTDHRDDDVIQPGQQQQQQQLSWIRRTRRASVVDTLSKTDGELI